MNIRVEPKRNSETEIKRGDSLRDGCRCGMSEAAGAKKGNENMKQYLGFIGVQKWRIFFSSQLFACHHLNLHAVECNERRT